MASHHALQRYQSLHGPIVYTMECVMRMRIGFVCLWLISPYYRYATHEPEISWEAIHSSGGTLRIPFMRH
jgi:hypothetical protein